MILHTVIFGLSPKGFVACIFLQLHKSRASSLFPLQSKHISFLHLQNSKSSPSCVHHLLIHISLTNPTFLQYPKIEDQMHPILSAALFSLLPLSFAANIPIAVGNGGLIFNPSIVTANVGDTLSFSYYPRNHSVAQSSFADPCHPLASSGIFSGFQPLSAGPGPVEFVVEVNDTKPIWIYCSQAKGSHCQNGMAMVVNQP